MAFGTGQNGASRFEIMSNFMSGETARSLELLRAIDGTIEALIYIRRGMDALSETCESLTHRAFSEIVEGKSMADTVKGLGEARDHSLRALTVMQTKRQAACSAPELADDDGVTEAYDQVVESISGLISRIERLIAVVTEQVAALKMTPLERKQARNRAPLLRQETLNSVAKSNADFLKGLGQASREK